MKKDILLFSHYLSDNYELLKIKISKEYYLELDIYHDSIIAAYEYLMNGARFNSKEASDLIIGFYKKQRNIKIAENYKEKLKEDSILEFIDNKTDLKIEYSNSFKNIKDTARILLSKDDFILLDLYFFQNKSKRIISLFTQKDVKEITKRIEFIKSKLSKKIRHENYKATVYAKS